MVCMRGESELYGGVGCEALARHIGVKNSGLLVRGACCGSCNGCINRELETGIQSHARSRSIVRFEKQGQRVVIRVPYQER